MTPEVDEKLMKRYLLNDLSEAERAQVQERLFADDDFFETLLDVENDLVDAYAQAELPPRERGQFERHWLSTPARREKVRHARALLSIVNEPVIEERAASHAEDPARSENLKRPDTSAWFHRWQFNKWALSTALVSAICIIVFGSLWLFMQTKRGNNIEADMARATPQQQPSNNSSLPVVSPSPENRFPREQQTLKQPSRTRNSQSSRPPVSGDLSASSLFTALLAPGAVRAGSDVKRLDIPNAARIVRLQLELEDADANRTYAVSLKTASGVEVFSRGDLRSRRVRGGHIIVVELSSDLLKPENYELTLAGESSARETEIVDYYNFTVGKR